MAQSLPPELAADALLRVAGSRSNHDGPWKFELLEQAFRLGALAREPNRKKGIAIRAVARSRAELLSIGFDQRLDRLSLQCRAVREMLKLDRGEAFDMFQQIVWPQLRALECRDALVDHVEDYYGLLAEIVESAFTPDQRRSGRHVELLSSQLDRMSSSVEVAPAAKMLSSASLTQDELNFLTSRFAAALDRIATDNRSFSTAFRSTGEALQQLAHSVAAKTFSANGLLAAYRQYLGRNLKGSWCADTVGNEFASSVRDSFNRNFVWDVDDSQAPLRADEFKPSRIDVSADEEPFVSSDEFERVWAQYLDLLLGKGHGPLLGRNTRPLTDEEKRTLEWRTQFDEFLGQIDELSPKAGEPDHRHFYRKATGLQAALRVAPPGPERDKVIRQFVTLLRSSNLQHESLLEWYAQLQRTSVSMRGLGPEAIGNFLEELERSGNTILVFYAVAARVIPPPK